MMLLSRLGRLRLRAAGSDGGHNGLKSIIVHLGENFMRLRIGVGDSTDAEGLTDHVLSEFDRSEKPTIESAIDRAAEAIEHLAQTRNRLGDEQLQQSRMILTHYETSL